MLTLFRITVHFIFITLIGSFSANIKAAENPFEIRISDGTAPIQPPYTLVSGKQYRLQAVSFDEKMLPAQWFLSGNLGSITTGMPSVLTAVFVGAGSLICRVEDQEQRVELSVVPKTKVLGSSGGELQSPAGVAIALPRGALAIERKIGIEIVAPPGLPPPLWEGFSTPMYIQISPRNLVLKRPAQLTFLFGDATYTRHNPLNPPYQADTDEKPQLYFWEPFGKKWVPLQEREDKGQGGVTIAINHFGIYALMAAAPEDLKYSERLEIQNLELSPRVFFAPDKHRLTITYRLNAPDTTQVFVTMDIFDLRGRRVRRLLGEVPRYIGPNAAQWDGLTDDGVLVRNGRYLLVIRARTGSQQVVQRKLIVVFK